MRRESAVGVLSRLRRLRRPLGSAALALFTASWLGLAVQPCLAHASSDEPAQASVTHHAGGCGGEAEPAPQATPTHDCPHCASDDAAHAAGCGTALDCDAVGLPGLSAKPTEPPRADLGAWIDLPLPDADPGLAPRLVRAAAAALAPRAPPRLLQHRYGRFHE